MTTPTTSSSTTSASTTSIRRRRGMTEEAAIAAVYQACRALRLPGIRAKGGRPDLRRRTRAAVLPRVPHRAADARVRRPGPSPLRARVKAAGFPRDKWIGDFDFEANPNSNPATIHQLATSTWVKDGSRCV